MNRILILLGSLLLASCPALGIGGGSVDLAKTADTVMLYRKDVELLAPLAKPETQAKVAKLVAEIVKVEDALRAAAAGGPVVDVTTAAKAALALAAHIASTLPDGSDLRFAIALAQVALNHLVAAEFGSVEAPQ